MLCMFIKLEINDSKLSSVSYNNTFIVTTRSLCLNVQSCFLQKLHVTKNQQG